MWRCIIQHLTCKKQAQIPYLPTFWLHFSVKGDPTAWVVADLPTPNCIEFTIYGALLAWQVDGYFGTQKGIEYLNDTIGKITIALKENSPQRLPWKPDLRSADHYYPKIHKLRDFKGLEIVRKRKAPQRADSYDDYAFWAIKLYTEDLIREYGEGTPVPYPIIEEWALSQFFDKEHSTIRAKCRSVWNWYDERRWTSPKSKRRFEMTRSERAKANSQKIAQETKRKIINAVTGMFAQEYKKSNGTWNISKLSKELKMSRNTVIKYLKEFQDNN